MPNINDFNDYHEMQDRVWDRIQHERAMYRFDELVVLSQLMRCEDCEDKFRVHDEIPDGLWQCRVCGSTRPEG